MFMAISSEGEVVVLAGVAGRVGERNVLGDFLRPACEVSGISRFLAAAEDLGRVRVFMLHL